jgi:hypothetical protein
MIMHNLNNVSAGRLLDVATGRGSFIHMLLEHLRDFEEMIGIDVQSGAAAIFAAAFPQPNIRFLCMDAAHIPAIYAIPRYPHESRQFQPTTRAAKAAAQYNQVLRTADRHHSRIHPA